MTNQTDVNVIKVDLVSPIVLSERGNDSDVIVRVKEKDYKAAIRSRYQYSGQTVHLVFIEGFDEEKMKVLGVTFDTSDVIKAHKAKVEEREALRKAAAIEKHKVVYQNWSELASTLKLKLQYTLEEYLEKSGFISLAKEEVYNGFNIKVTVSKDGLWWEVRKNGSYNRKDIRKTQSSTKLVELIRKQLEEARFEVDSQIRSKNTSKELLKNAKGTFGEDITEGSYGYRAGNDYRYEKVFELKFGESWHSPKIQFRAYGDNKYIIKAIDGCYSEADIKAILNVVRNAKA